MYLFIGSTTKALGLTLLPVLIIDTTSPSVRSSTLIRLDWPLSVQYNLDDIQSTATSSVIK